MIIRIDRDQGRSRRLSSQAQQGFTLLEVMIALGIFAVLAAATFASLQAFVNTRDAIERSNLELAKIQKAMWIIGNDLQHLVARNIRDPYGDHIYALTNRREYELEFTRQGWSNPRFKTRSELQRVAYQVGRYDDDGERYGEDTQQLLRYYWRVLDQVEDSEPKKQVLLDDIESFEVGFRGLYAADEPVQEWPIDPKDNDFDSNFPEDRMPSAIFVSIETEKYGSFRRVFQLSDFQEKTN